MLDEADTMFDAGFAEDIRKFYIRSIYGTVYIYGLYTVYIRYSLYMVYIWYVVTN